MTSRRLLILGVERGLETSSGEVSCTEGPYLGSVQEEGGQWGLGG